MWIVAKIKNSELDIFKRELTKKLNTKPLFYNPRIQVEKNEKNKIRKYSKSILENYIFCFDESFKNTKIVHQLKFVKGLNFFLNGYNLNQKEIINFINYCQSFENNEGFIKALFFGSPPEAQNSTGEKEFDTTVAAIEDGILKSKSYDIASEMSPLKNSYKRARCSFVAIDCPSS